MTKNQLRKMLMIHGDAVKSLTPTPTQRRIFTAGRVLGVLTSAQVSDKFKISVENASAQLKALHDKGYLARRIVGTQYTYQPITWS